MVANAVRIGILGAARIAPTALVKPARMSVDGVQVVAVAARDVRRAKGFAAKHGIATVHSGYAALLADDSVDAVYNPLPNGLHGYWTIEALRAGKHVLCEKPFTANADEAAAVAAVATGDRARRDGGVPLPLPPARLAHGRDRRSGELGELRDVRASVCFPLPMVSDIRFQLNLAGGALMDAGCYRCTWCGRWVAGSRKLWRQSEVAQAGVDRAMRATLRFAAGQPGTSRVRCGRRTCWRCVCG